MKNGDLKFTAKGEAITNNAQNNPETNKGKNIYKPAHAFHNISKAI